MDVEVFVGIRVGVFVPVAVRVSVADARVDVMAFAISVPAMACAVN